MTDTMNVKLTIDPWEPTPHPVIPAPPSDRITDDDIPAFLAAFDHGYGDGGGWLR